MHLKIRFQLKKLIILKSFWFFSLISQSALVPAPKGLQGPSGEREPQGPQGSMGP